MKTLALDLGDVWVGVAISDATNILARPYDTTTSKELFRFLRTLFEKEKIGTVVVGLPVTLKGTESEQTKKVRATYAQLVKKFPEVTWVLEDERLTSQQAAELSKAHTKQEKLRSHARAAAFILQTYLDGQSLLK